MKKTYLFDFDGTLVDSMPYYKRMLARILEDDGIPFDDGIMRTVTPLGVIGTAKYYAEVLGVPRGVDEILDKMAEYALDDYKFRIQPKCGVVEALRALAAAGHSLNILTASPHLSLDPCLERIGIYDLFDNVWSCDDFSTNKANPQIYKAAAERLSVAPSELIFLDDNLHADKCAKSAGVKVVGVYDESSAQSEREMREVCDGYVYQLSELLTLEL